MAEANKLTSPEAGDNSTPEKEKGSCNGNANYSAATPSDDLELRVDYLSDSQIKKLTLDLHELLGPYLKGGDIPDLVLSNRECQISIASLEKKQVVEVPVNYETHPHILKLTEGVPLSGKYGDRKLILKFGYKELTKEEAIKVIQWKPNLNFVDFFTTLLKEINMWGELVGLYNLNIEATAIKKGAMENIWKDMKNSKQLISHDSHNYSFNIWKSFVTSHIETVLPTPFKSSTWRVCLHLKVKASDPFRNPKELMDCLSWFLDYYEGHMQLKDFITTLYGIASAHLTYKGKQVDDEKVKTEMYVYEAKLMQLVKFNYCNDSLTTMKTDLKWFKILGQDCNRVKIYYQLLLEPTKTRSVGLDLMSLIDSSVTSETILEEIKDIFVLDKVEIRGDHVIFH